MPAPEDPNGEPPEPDWQLLPHDPQGFFGLADGFDRKDLKRSYNRLLRRYKPEKFPDEFQKLRAAYESVDDRLRYFADGGEGFSPRPFGRPSAQRKPDPDATPPADRPAGATPRETVLDLVQQRGAQAAFAHLAVTAESIEDYYHLAVLSDVVATNTAQRGTFAGWLLTGAEKADGAGQVATLLHEWAREPHSAEEIEVVLRRLAAIGHAGFFGYVGEPLWIQLLEKLAFSDWANLFAQCRRRLGQESHPSFFQLMSRIYRAAMFFADDEWLRRQSTWLEDAYFQTGGTHLDEDLDLAESLSHYRAARDAFRNGDPLREAIDATIVALSTSSQADADQRFHDLQVQLSEAGAALLESLPVDDPSIAGAARVLDHYSWDIAARIDVPTPSPDETRQWVRQFLNRIESLTDRNWLGLTWHLWRVFVALAIPGGMLVLLVSIVLNLDWQWAVPLFLGGAVAGFLLYRHIVLRYCDLDPWFTRRLYDRLWRNEARRFLTETSLPLALVVQLIPEARTDENTVWDDLLPWLHRDAGLAIFAVGRRVG